MRRIQLIQQRKSLAHLRKKMLDFGTENIKAKEEFFRGVSSLPLTDASTIVQYQDLLLFISAYAEGKVIYNLAQEELKRIAVAAKEIFLRSNERAKARLINSGVANTQLNVSFSYDLVKWLEEKFPDNISIFSCDADKETIQSVFISGLLKPETDRFREESFSLIQLIRKLKPDNKISDLKWLINFLINISVSSEIRDHLYDSLKIFISLSLDESIPSLTTARSLPRRIFFHQNGLMKKFEALKVIQDKKIKSHKLSIERKEKLLSNSRMILCVHQREIDPITYANLEELEFFDMGRGIDIALFPMIPQRKLSIESYIGYMAFKNGIPAAYGGGWIYLFHSKIGVNVFPALRGGESSYLFCQILRLYHHHFNVKKFIVEPYQIGKNNSEGIKSGAYWFYYRLGFRSVNDELKTLAEKEFRRISSEKKYRSSISVMRKMTNSNLELNLSPTENYPDADAETLSESITQFVNSHFEGDRSLVAKVDLPESKRGKSERESILEMQQLARVAKRVEGSFMKLFREKI
ncbi:MAG: hypothetical protein ACHQD9_03685 [Chitinophagales bacterium]